MTASGTDGYCWW